MSLLRLVIAWLVMAALPLQGMAAASMLFCGQAAHSAASQQAGHDHASHGHGHDQAGHGDASHHGHADSEPDPAADHDEPAAAGLADEGHSCPICASCCSLVAMPETPALTLDPAPLASMPAADAVRVDTRSPLQPDKPPRA